MRFVAGVSMNMGRMDAEAGDGEDRRAEETTEAAARINAKASTFSKRRPILRDVMSEEAGDLGKTGRVHECCFAVVVIIQARPRRSMLHSVTAEMKRKRI